jgi:hypothetical protein
MTTVEGNSSSQIRFVSYRLDDVYSKARGFQFINACLAPHELDMRMVYIGPGLPIYIPWVVAAEMPGACRTVPKCKPKGA